MLDDDRTINNTGGAGELTKDDNLKSRLENPVLTLENPVLTFENPLLALGNRVVTLEKIGFPSLALLVANPSRAKNLVEQCHPSETSFIRLDYDRPLGNDL